MILRLLMLMLPSIVCAGALSDANQWLAEKVQALDERFGVGGSEQTARIAAEVHLGQNIFEDETTSASSQRLDIQLPRVSRRLQNLVGISNDSPINGTNGGARTAEVDFGVNFGLSRSGDEFGVASELERTSAAAVGPATFDTQFAVGYDTLKQVYARHQVIVGTLESDRYAPRVTTRLDWSQDEALRLGTGMKFFRSANKGAWEEFAWTQSFEVAPEPQFEKMSLERRQQFRIGDDGWFGRLGGGLEFREAEQFEPKPFLHVGIGLRLDSAATASIWDSTVQWD
ncbi:MAG: hypothetical protein HWE20_13035 [Gammaproteobacteria bacterium]|nr:hypothetical protein [Gammaproteobacteria bacterium]